MPKVPGLDKGMDTQLTDEARRAIDAYLRKYGRVALGTLGGLGFTTIVSLLLSVFYIFFELPEVAANRAFHSWSTQFERYEKKIEDSLVQASELRGKVKLTEEENEKLRKDQQGLQESLETLKKERDSLQTFLDKISISDLERAAAIAASLEAQDVVVAKQESARAIASASAAGRRVDNLEEDLRGAEQVLEGVLVRLQQLEEDTPELFIDPEGESVEPER